MVTRALIRDFAVPILIDRSLSGIESSVRSDMQRLHEIAMHVCKIEFGKSIGIGNPTEQTATCTS
jgi:hypothetical protein